MPAPRRRPAQRKSSARRVRIKRSRLDPVAHPPAAESLADPNGAPAVPTPSPRANSTGAKRKRHDQVSAPRDFLTIQEVADRMEISAKTVQRLIDSKDPAQRISAVRVGGQVRIPIGEYHRYAASRPAARP